MQSAPNGAIDQLQHTAGTQSIGGSLQPVPAQPGGLSAPAILASDTLAQSAPAPGMSVQQSGGAGFPTGPSSSPALADPRAFDPAGSAPVALGRPFNAIQSLGLAPLSAGIASLVGVADRAPHPRPAPGPGPRGPTSPPADGTGFSNSFFSSGLAALLLAALILAAAAMARRVRMAPACWRPVPFVSLLERPG